MERVTDFIFLDSKNTTMVTVAMKLKEAWACALEKAMPNLDSIL